MILPIGIILILLLFSIILHEVAHAYTAYLLGDNTPVLANRLTLNPLRHIDPLWTLIIPFFFFLSSLFTNNYIIIGAAKPVPINIYNFRNPLKDMAIVGISGPLVNFFLAIIFIILAKIPLKVFNIFYILSYMNIFLAFLNLTPIPPLDGSRIAYLFLPKSLLKYYTWLEQKGMGILIVLFLFIFTPYKEFIVSLTYFIFKLIGGGFGNY